LWQIDLKTRGFLPENVKVLKIDGTEIAIIGMAGRFPGARDLKAFWRNLCDGIESIHFFTDDQLMGRVDPALLQDSNFVKAASLLDDVELFDASFFGMSHREAEITDPQHRLLLECAWEAMEKAGYYPDNYDGPIGVFAGATINTYLLFNIAKNPELASSLDRLQLNIGNAGDFLTTRISYKLNLKGPSHTVQSACSTSLVAVHIACQSLLNEECDMALAGGASVNVSMKNGYLYQEGGITSPDGHCRAFDANGRGTIFGSGVGIVLLKRLEDAIADRDIIHAVIKGSAINNDGSLKVGYTAPSVDGQSQVIAEALANAGVEAETIGYVEAHGTATPLGDPVEVAALTKAFRATTQKKNYCAIGTVKSNIGHLDAAAGVAGLIKTVLCLKQKMLVPSLHFEEANPEIDFTTSPFYVSTTTEQWERGQSPRRAGVSSFGVGGTNAHLIVEEAPLSGRELEREETEGAEEGQREWHVLMLSARSEEALEEATRRLSEHLKRAEAGDAAERAEIADIAYTLQVGRKVFSHRRAVVCRDYGDSIDALDSLVSKSVFTGSQEIENRPVVFMFTGQGSQRANMGLYLYKGEPIFRKHVDLCSELLNAHLKVDLREIIYTGEKSSGSYRQIDQTRFTQPALFVIEYALAKLWMSWGVRPDAMIGHSIGEYVAACLSKVISLEDALAIVSLRGELVQGMPGGAMLAVPMSEDEISSRIGGTLSIAALNGPSLSVVSGSFEDLEDLERKLSHEGLSCRRLNTSHAFHSEMLEPILDRFIDSVSRIRLNPPEIPFISNVTGDWITEDDACDARYWGRHLRQTVRFSDGLGQLFKDPRSILLEVGPGETLSRLASRHPKGKMATVIASLEGREGKESEVESVAAALGRLWVSGVPIDWEGFYLNQKRRRVELPTYPFEKQLYWIEENGASVESVKLRRPSEKEKSHAGWLYAPAWRPALPINSKAGHPIEENGCWLIFDRDNGYGEKAALRLQELGQKIIRVKSGERFERLGDGLYIINPRCKGDYEALINELSSSGVIPGRVLHFWSLIMDGRADSFENIKAHGFYSLLFLAQSLNRVSKGSPVRIGIISSNTVDITGSETVHPEKAIILGPSRVIPQEYPNLICRFIDIALPSSDAAEQRLLDKLISEIDAAPEVGVAYRGDQRWAQTFELLRPLSDFGSNSALRERGTYIVTGGLSGAGFLFSEFLAREYKARLTLLEDPSFPDRRLWEQISTGQNLEQDEIACKIDRVLELERLGAQVAVMSIDICDESQMRAAIVGTVERCGAINGVIHSADMGAENSFRLIQELDSIECEKQLRPRVQALYALEKALEEIDPDFCLLSSSLSSILGGLGTFAYSSANLFMDAFVNSYNKKSRSQWISVNWDAWQHQGMSDPHAPAGAQIHRDGILPDKGIEAFRHILSMGPVGQVVVSVSDLSERIEKWIKNASSHAMAIKSEKRPSSLHPRPSLHTPYIAPEETLEEVITEIWQDALGVEAVGVNDNFFELGGDSVLAIQISVRLKRELEMEIPVASLYEGLTVRTLARLIRSEQGEDDQGGEELSQPDRREERLSRRKSYQQKQRDKKKQVTNV
jgi:acyl transferase domain-containing protein/acyl carrier protein